MDAPEDHVAEVLRRVRPEYIRKTYRLADEDWLVVMNAANPGVFTHVVLNDIGPELSKVGLDRISGYVGQGGPISTWE